MSLRLSFQLSPLMLAVSLAIPLAAVAAEPAANVLESAAARWSAEDVKETPSFTKHVVPLFSKVGCSSRSCHGSFQGQGGSTGEMGRTPTINKDAGRDHWGKAMSVCETDDSLDANHHRCSVLLPGSQSNRADV